MVHIKRRPQLAIFQDETRTPGNQFEWTKCVCRISNHPEEQPGRGGCSQLPVQLVFVSGAQSVLVERSIPWAGSVIANPVMFIEETIRGGKVRFFLVHSLFSFPLSINNGADVVGSAWATFCLCHRSPSYWAHFPHALSLRAQAGALVSFTSFGIVLSLSSPTTAFREPAFQPFEWPQYRTTEIYAAAVPMQNPGGDEVADS